MAYVVNRYNDSVLTVVEDYTVNTNFDIKLIGRHYIDYGEIQNENMVFMLENFCNAFPPTNPLDGQLWYDSYYQKLNIFDSNNDDSGFVSVNRPIVSAVQPDNMSHGEMWFNTLEQKLYIHNGLEFISIGPSEMGLIGGPGDGNLNFWWDSTTFKLYVVDEDNEESYLIGPSEDEALAFAHIF